MDANTVKRDPNSREKRIVDAVASNLHKIESAIAAQHDAHEWEDLYAYTFLKLGIPDTPEARKAFNAGFGVCALTP